MNLPLLDSPTPGTPPGDAPFQFSPRKFLESIPDDVQRHNVVILTYRLLSHARMSAVEDGEMLRALTVMERELSTLVTMAGTRQTGPRVAYGEAPK